ncbi:MAG: hypothetical protein ACLQPN_19925 [Bryobacteraceae bacterium]
MLRKALDWIRQHPVRCAAYALVVAGAVWTGVTARGIVRGERNALLTRAARAPVLRDWVDREFHIRYSVDAVALVPQCGFEIDVHGVSVEVAGVASGSVDEAKVCVSGSGELRGIRIGDKMVALQAVQFDWPKFISGSGFSWSDRDGEIASATGFSASLNDISGSLRNLRVLTIASVDSASAALEPQAGSAITVKSAAARGIKLDVDPASIALAPVRLQAAASALQAMGAAALPLPAQWSATARRLLVGFLIGTAIFLFALKVLVTRAPASIAWRIGAILAPFAAFPLLALTDSRLAIVIAAPVIAIALWALAYHHAEYWHQRWEPAAVDVPAVLLALLLLVLRNWPVIATPQLPVIHQINVAQVDVSNITATVHQPACGASGAVHIAVPQAGVTNLRVGLNGSALESIDIQRATANGAVQTGALADLQRIRFLPPAWQKTPPLAFCAAVTLRNSGPSDLPDAACPSGVKAPAVIARAAVDYTGQQARFAADWDGAPAPVAVAGSANLEGAKVDDLHTKPGAPVHIGRASARIAWEKSITANAQIEGIEASGVSVARIVLTARTPMPCATGPTSVTADLGKTRYSFGGNTVQLDGATLAFARPNSSSFSARAQTARLSLSGPIEASIPESDFRLEGATSPESIPRILTAQAAFDAGSIGFSTPIRLTANLWNGQWQLPHQSLTLRQQITSRIPPAITLEFEASGGVVSLASPLEASARAQVRIPQLIPDTGPTSIELNDLRVDGAWDAATGLTPAHISSGWNIVTVTGFPSGFQLNEVSTLQLSTHGEALEAPKFEVPQIAIPSIPHEIRFRLQGTPQTITIAIDGGEQFTLDNIETRNLTASLPEFKLASLDVDTSAQVKRSHALFPFSGHTHLTDASVDTVLRAPLGAELSLEPQALHFTLNQPLDTGKLFNEVGLSLSGIQPQATLTDLQANARFAGQKLAGLDAAGTIAAGPLAVGDQFGVSQQAPATFHVSAPQLPKVTVSAAAPGVAVTLNGGKLRASVGANVSLNLTLADSPSSPLFMQLRDAATGLGDHVQKAVQVFGAENTSAFPLRWDVEVTGGSPAVSLTPDRIAINMNTLLPRVGIGQDTIDGSMDLHAVACSAEDHLLLDVNAPTDIGAFGRRWQLNTPIVIALRKDLLPGTGGELFDSAFYSRIGCIAKPGADSLRLAVGYGDSLQVHAAFQQPFTSGRIGALAQAAIRWQPGAASIDSFGTFTFRGLEAGTIAFPSPYLEDRLDGDVRFSTRGFLADRLLAPQLLADASRVRQLDGVDLSLQVRSAADGAHLPGILQAASGITLKPANQFVQLLTSGLDLTLPPRALQYQHMALDFRVQQGQVQTEPVLLTLNGVQVFGIAGFTLDSKVRILWGGHGQEPAPRLRDLIYTVQRVMER